MSEEKQPLALFTSSDGQVRLQLKLVEQSLWLTQRQIAELFEKSPKTISEHIANIYEEGELDPAATIRKFRTVALEGALWYDNIAIEDLSSYRTGAWLAERPCTIKNSKSYLVPQQAMLGLLDGMT